MSTKRGYATDYPVSGVRTTDYLVRSIPEHIRARALARGQQEHRSLRWIVIAALEAYGNHQITLGKEQPCRSRDTNGAKKSSTSTTARTAASGRKTSSSDPTPGA